ALDAVPGAAGGRDGLHDRGRRPACRGRSDGESARLSSVRVSAVGGGGATAAAARGGRGRAVARWTAGPVVVLGQGRRRSLSEPTRMTSSVRGARWGRKALGGVALASGVLRGLRGPGICKSACERVGGAVQRGISTRQRR